MSSSETDEDVVEVQPPCNHGREDLAADADADDDLEFTDIDLEEDANTRGVRNEDNHDARGQQQRVQVSAAETTWEPVTILTQDLKRAMSMDEVNGMVDAEKASSEVWREYLAKGAPANFSKFFLRLIEGLLETERLRAPNSNGHLAPLVGSKEFVSFSASRKMGRRPESHGGLITLGWWCKQGEKERLGFAPHLNKLNPTLMRVRVGLAALDGKLTSGSVKLRSVTWNKKYIPNCGEVEFESFPDQTNGTGITKVSGACLVRATSKQVAKPDQGTRDSAGRGVPVKIISEDGGRELSTQEVNAILDGRKLSSRTWKDFEKSGSTSTRILSQFLCEEVSTLLKFGRLWATNKAGLLAPLVLAAEFRNRVEKEGALKKRTNDNKVLLGWWDKDPSPLFLDSQDMRLYIILSQDKRIRAIRWNKQFLTSSGKETFESLQPMPGTTAPTCTRTCYCQQPSCKALYERIRSSDLPADHPYRSEIKQYQATDSANSIALLLSISLHFGVEYKRSVLLHSHHWPEALLLSNFHRTTPLSEDNVKELYGKNAHLLLSNAGKQYSLQSLSQHSELRGKIFRKSVREVLTSGQLLFSQAPLNCLEEIAVKCARTAVPVPHEAVALNEREAETKSAFLPRRRSVGRPRKESDPQKIKKIVLENLRDLDDRDADVVANALARLSEACQKDEIMVAVKDTIASLEVIPKAIEVLRENPKSKAIQEHGCCLLSCWTWSEDDAFASGATATVHKHGGISVLLKALDRFPYYPHIQKGALLALNNLLADTDKTRHRQFVGPVGWAREQLPGIRLVLAAMDLHPEDVMEVVIPASSIVESLCYFRDLLPRVKRSGCLQKTVDVISKVLHEDRIVKDDQAKLDRGAREELQDRATNLRLLLDDAFASFRCRGINNVGQSCYASAAIQLLCSAPGFLNVLQVQLELPARRGNSDLARKLLELGLIPASGLNGQQTRPADPSELISDVRGTSHRFEENVQHDAEEFLRYLLERFTESFNLKDELQWTLRITRTCQSCSEARRDTERHLILPVAIAKEERSMEPAAIVDCLWNFFRNEVEAQCPKCNRKTPQDWKASAMECPKHLLVHLKRFETSHGENGRIDKDSYRISIPEELNLRPMSAIDPPPVYKLRGFLIHIGDSIDSGHYVSYGSRPRNDGPGHGWVEFDDESTCEVPLRKTLSLAEIQENAYLVLYSLETDSRKRAVSDGDRSTTSSLAAGPLDSTSARRQRQRASDAAEPAGEVLSGGAMAAAAPQGSPLADAPPGSASAADGNVETAAADAAAAPQGSSPADAPPGWASAVDRVVERVLRRLYRSTYSDNCQLSGAQIRGRQAAMDLHKSDPGAVRGFVRAYLRGAAADGEPFDAERCSDEWIEKCASELVDYAKYV